MPPTTFEIAQQPDSAANAALLHYRSTSTASVFLEGKSDRRALSRFFVGPVRLVILEEKGKVIRAIEIAVGHQRRICQRDYALGVIDIDYDRILGRLPDSTLPIVPVEICPRGHHVRDLETFLLKTEAFEAVLDEFDIRDRAGWLRAKVVSIAASVGCIRLTNERRKMALSRHLGSLRGDDMPWSDVFNSKTVECDVIDLARRLARGQRWSDAEVEVLVMEVEKEIATISNEWELARGHDVCELVALYLNETSQTRLRGGDIERMLRLALRPSMFQPFAFPNSIGRHLAPHSVSFPT